MADAKSEALAIKKMGGKAQKNSGRGAVAKGDATLGPFLVDVKEYKTGYTVNLDNWAKICSDAVRMGRMQPALNVIMGETNRVGVWVVSDRMFHEMLSAWEEKYGD